MSRIIIVSLIVFTNSLISCTGQSSQTELKNTINKPLVGGGCDGCELMFIGMPSSLNERDTSAGWSEKGQHLIITGTIYKADGITPAPDVILYYWQTNNQGLYVNKPGLQEQASRHGYIRGWIKTDSTGKYSIYTVRPAPYPKDVLPAHIHLSIKEPGISNPYYAEDIVFDDDPLLINHLKKYPMENRCGSGIVRVLLKDELQIAEHDLVLGLNIPNYPVKAADQEPSGLEIGEDQPSFIPYHAYGPDKGTQVCPVCKYGRYHGIIYFVGNKPNWKAISTWLTFLEQESIRRKDYLKVYFVYGNEKGYEKEVRTKELEAIGKALSLRNTALTFVPSFMDKDTEANLNKINPEVENTFIIYKHRSIVGKYINLEANQKNFSTLSTLLDKTRGEYFNLAEPAHE